MHEKFMQSFFFKPGGMTPLRRPRCRWEGNIKVIVGEIGLEVVDCIRSAQDRGQWRFL
jgi:hypothetical protein